MIVRDIDVLSRPARRANVSVTFSVPTLDQEIWRYTEPHTPPPVQRLEALRKLVDAGIKAGVGIAPILPGLSDKPELLADVVKAARDHGATPSGPTLLYLRPGTREHFLDKLSEVWPELVAHLREALRQRPGVSARCGNSAAASACQRPCSAVRDRRPAPPAHHAGSDATGNRTAQARPRVRRPGAGSAVRGIARQFGRND